MALLGLMLLLGWRDNKLVFVLFPSLIVIVAVRLVISLITDGVRKTIFSSDVLLIAIAGLSFFILLIVSPLTIKNIYWQAIQVPGWALDRAEDYFYYVRFLFVDYPLFPLFFSVGSYLMCRRSGRTGACLVAAALIPLLLLSIVLNWRTARYISHLMPLFYIVMSVGMVASIEWVVSICKSLIKERSIAFNDKRLSKIVVMILATTYLWFVPWTTRIFDVISSPTGVYQIRNNFRATAEYFRSDIADDDVVVVTIQPLMLAYYLGRNVDFLIDEHWGKELKIKNKNHRSGATALFGLDDVTAMFANHKRGWIFVEKDQWDTGTLFKLLRNTINKNTRLIENKETDSILVFASLGVYNPRVLPDLVAFAGERYFNHTILLRIFYAC